MARKKSSRSKAAAAAADSGASSGSAGAADGGDAAASPAAAAAAAAAQGQQQQQQQQQPRNDDGHEAAAPAALVHASFKRTPAEEGALVAARAIAELARPAGHGWVRKKLNTYGKAWGKQVAWGLWISGTLAPLGLLQPHALAAFVWRRVPLLNAMEYPKGAAGAALRAVNVHVWLLVLLAYVGFKRLKGRGRAAALAYLAMGALVARGDYFAASLLYQLENVGAFFMMGVVAACLSIAKAVAATAARALAAPTPEDRAAAALAGAYSVCTMLLVNFLAFFPQPAFATLLGGVWKSGDASRQVTFWVGRAALRALSALSAKWDVQMYAAIPADFFMTRQQFALFRTFTPAQSACIALGDMLMAGFWLDPNRRAGALGALLMGYGLLSAGVTPTYGYWLPAAMCVTSAVVHATSGAGIDKRLHKVKKGGFQGYYWAALALGWASALPRWTS